jgi:Zn-dependent peptidase ImmA (M78 family)
MTNRPTAPRDRAVAILQDCKVTRPPVPIERIAKHLGAIVRYQPLDEEISGMIHILDKVPIVGVNALHHPNRQRFTVAHELGHLVMHRELITGHMHVDKGFQVLMRDPKAASGTDRVEIDANQFASELLMPRFLLAPILETLKLQLDDEVEVEKLAKRFRVSKQAMGHRIGDLMAPWG